MTANDETKTTELEHTTRLLCKEALQAKIGIRELAPWFVEAPLK